MEIMKHGTDYRVFEMLVEGKEISGEEMAKKLGVSRMSVWKAIEKIKSAGIEIKSKTKVGYRILSRPDPNPFDVARISFKNLGHLVDEVKYYTLTDSTNERARSIAKPGILFFAEQQSSGRGRMGRKWYSEKGGLYFSLTLQPKISIEDLPKLTLVTGLAVAKAIDGKLKWPNDVLLDGKKVCGILCELVGEIERPVVIVGIGINVKNEIPPELKENATRLADFGNWKILDVFDMVTASFYFHYELLLSGEWYRLRENIIELCDSLGKKVKVVTHSRTYEGVAEEIDENGALIVNGERIYAGECFYI
jgi:BirA family biotin operon repressor/biotin-[acetyl-CoA-carboxylase] ligase